MCAKYNLLNKGTLNKKQNGNIVKITFSKRPRVNPGFIWSHLENEIWRFDIPRSVILFDMLQWIW